MCIVQTALLQSSENKEGLEKIPTITAALDTSWHFTVLVALPLQAPRSQSHSEDVSTQMLLSSLDNAGLFLTKERHRLYPST